MTGPLTVKHVWDSVDRRWRWRPNPPANVNELHQVLIQEWNNQHFSQFYAPAMHCSGQFIIKCVVFFNPYHTWSKFLPVC